MKRINSIVLVFSMSAIASGKILFVRTLKLLLTK
jgi:hypothetical protein